MTVRVNGWIVTALAVVVVALVAAGSYLGWPELLLGGSLVSLLGGEAERKLRHDRAIARRRTVDKAVQETRRVLEVSDARAAKEAEQVVEDAAAVVRGDDPVADSDRVRRYLVNSLPGGSLDPNSAG